MVEIQRLRCRVAFHALQFRPEIQMLGNRMVNKMGGPVQYRWMYPFERYLNKLKRMVKNKSRVEGSICEAYLCQETSYFCSYYFESHVESMRNKVGRNDDGGENDTIQQTLSIFNHSGRSGGTCKARYLNDRELDAAHLHILLNCVEVQPYIQCFEQYLEATIPNISRIDIDGRIASEFPLWFRTYDEVDMNEEGEENEFVESTESGEEEEEVEFLEDDDNEHSQDGSGEEDEFFEDDD
ncbi:hypothetical protein RJT34_23796 [Clitoria ternatea]|uniref:DUF4218 domain-containing protein n=1 Tax=Clitoria ternatea TaxID=43366 RepID=A0AAN9FSY6_CLITE